MNKVRGIIVFLSLVVASLVVAGCGIEAARKAGERAADRKGRQEAAQEPKAEP
ncbi:hypothetical protein BH23ACT11_BH23ACT11_27720 [soil metagenome]